MFVVWLCFRADYISFGFLVEGELDKDVGGKRVNPLIILEPSIKLGPKLSNLLWFWTAILGDKLNSKMGLQFSSIWIGCLERCNYFYNKWRVYLFIISINNWWFVFGCFFAKNLETNVLNAIKYELKHVGS